MPKFRSNILDLNLVQNRFSSKFQFTIKISNFDQSLVTKIWVHQVHIRTQNINSICKWAKSILGGWNKNIKLIISNQIPAQYSKNKDPLSTKYQLSRSGCIIRFIFRAPLFFWWGDEKKVYTFGINTIGIILKVSGDLTRFSHRKNASLCSKTGFWLRSLFRFFLQKSTDQKEEKCYKIDRPRTIPHWFFLVFMLKK